MRVSAILATAAAAAALTATVAGQARPAAATPNISGGWVRMDPSGNQSYGGIDAAFPRAQLKPEFAALLPPEMDQGLGPAAEAPTGPPHEAGQAYIIPNIQGREPRCGVGGGGAGVDINSVAMFMVSSKDE